MGLHEQIQYLNLIKKIIKTGKEKINKDGVKTKSIFGNYMEFDVQKTIPLLTTKKMHF